MVLNYFRDNVYIFIYIYLHFYLHLFTFFSYLSYLFYRLKNDKIILHNLIERRKEENDNLQKYFSVTNSVLQNGTLKIGVPFLKSQITL
jgi:hypothetical protein